MRTDSISAPLLSPTRIAGLLLVHLVLASVAAAAPPRKRFEAAFSDGSRVEGNQLRDWHANDSPPALEDKKLLDQANPFRWLVDRNLHPANDAYPAVEMHSGDRLPGTVVRFATDDGSAYPIRHDRLLVRPATELRPPASPPSAFVDVSVQHVKRIVWTAQARRRIEPGSAFLRDGRKISFRAIRFNPSSVRLRTSDGVKTLGFSELAELQLLQPASWESHWKELAELCPDGRARLLQLETNDGLIATTSLDRFRAFRRGSPTEFEKWVHGVQPAWSSQVLWAPSKNVWMRRSFAAHEVPLSRIAPSVAVSRSSLNGSPHPWFANRNREGRPMRSGGRTSGWGFGGHAFIELQFPLDPLVRKFQAEFGLDSLAGEGGSVKGRVALRDDAKAQPRTLAESPVLQGRAKPHRFDLTLAGESPDRGLTLTADPLDKAEPAGADPLDIRDAVDWLEPLLILDAQGVRQELARRSLRNPQAWERWAITSAEPKWDAKANDGAQLFKLPFVFDPAWRSFWDPSLDAPGGFTRGLVARDAPFRLSREVRLRPGKRQWLVATAYRPFHENEDVWIEARLDGVSLGRFAAPLREGGRRDYEPIVFELPPIVGVADRTAILELIQEPTKGSTPIVWAGAQLQDQRPRIAMLVDEEVAWSMKTAKGLAASRAKDAYEGAESARLKSGETYYLDLDPPIEFATANDYSTPRYLQLAYRKREQGRFGIVLHHQGDVDRPLRYHFGAAPYIFEPAIGVQTSPLADQWQGAMRDVVGDFGKVEVSGLSIVIPDGGELLIDRLCVGLHPTPLSQLMQRRSPDKPFPSRWDEFQKQFTNHVNAAIVHLQTPSGAFTGALISNSGEILASPRCLQRLNGQSATATLSDGRTVKAKPIGLAKAFNCGMLKIETAGPWPYIAIANQHRYRRGELMIAAKAVAPSDRQIQPTELAFQTNNRIWLRRTTDEHAVHESALIDPQGALVGFSGDDSAAGNSTFGSSVIRCRLLASHLDKLRKNELKDDWCAGAEPGVGLKYRFRDTGLEVESVQADSPAAKAGVQTGDIIRRFDDRDVRSVSDMLEVAAKHAAGDRVALRLERDGKSQDAAITLGE